MELLDRTVFNVDEIARVCNCGALSGEMVRSYWPNYIRNEFFIVDVEFLAVLSIVVDLCGICTADADARGSC
jgi:hypothetical protein